MASDLSSRFNGNNILDSSPCGLRVDWSYVRVFSWFALQMNHENQTTKSHEPGITKRHKGSADESSMLLPFCSNQLFCLDSSQCLDQYPRHLRSREFDRRNLSDT